MRNWTPPNIDRQHDTDIPVWTVAIGNLPLPIFMRKKTKQMIQFIREQDGFIGFYPCYPMGTLCLFKTENDAKGARNMMRFKGITCGDNICTIYIDEGAFE